MATHECKGEQPEEECPCKIMIKCPQCKTIQHVGKVCGICKAPLYRPFLIKDGNGKWALKTYKEIEEE